MVILKRSGGQKAQKPAAEYADQSNRSGLDRQNGIFTAATSGKGFFFWMGHFASRIQNSNFNQDLLNIVRQKALGNFGDLLKAVSKSASMLSFLNNQQNRKGHPNENFAREVMELFTMGRGHYTEKI